MVSALPHYIIIGVLRAPFRAHALVDYRLVDYLSVNIPLRLITILQIHSQLWIPVYIFIICLGHSFLIIE